MKYQNYNQTINIEQNKIINSTFKTQHLELDFACIYNKAR